MLLPTIAYEKNYIQAYSYNFKMAFFEIKYSILWKQLTPDIIYWIEINVHKD